VMPACVIKRRSGARPVDECNRILAGGWHTGIRKQKKPVSYEVTEPDLADEDGAGIPESCANVLGLLKAWQANIDQARSGDGAETVTEAPDEDRTIVSSGSIGVPPVGSYELCSG